MSSKSISDNKNTQDLKQSKSSKSLTRQSKLAKSDKENRNNTNMTPIKPKRFSAMIREIDYNAYRAYKMANEDPKINPKSRNPHDILKNDYNPMRVPFGLKSKRFTWQTEYSYNTLNELNGTLKNYSTASSYKAPPTWKDLIKRTEPIVKTKNIGSSRAYNYSIMVDINSKRTMNPKNDIIGKEDFLTPRRKILRSSSTGSICNLLNKTPLNKEIRIRDKSSREHGVFTTEYYNSNYYRKQKTSVELNAIKRKGDDAGACKIERSIDDFLYRTYDNNRSKTPMSIARRRKINTNMSDIFNTKTEKDNIYAKNGKRKQYTFEFSENQNAL